MTIHDAIQALEESKNPVARIIQKNAHFKMLAIAFKKGMIMKDHETNSDAKLTVLEGNVLFYLPDRVVRLHKYDVFDIPKDTVHSVEATEDSVCILTQG